MARRDLDGDRREALERLRAAQGAVERERFRPTRASDLFALPETASWPVEWLVLGPDPEATDRLLVVPADGYPLVAKGDVEVPAEVPGGPLTVRGRFPVSVPAPLLTASHRSGLLGPQATAAVAEVRERLAAGTLDVTEEDEEVEASPDYQEWIAEVVLPARDALIAAAARHPQATRDRARARFASRFGRLLPLAATLLLAAGLALAVALVVQGRHLADLESRLAAAEAPGASATAPLENLPFAWLRPEGDVTRGAAAPPNTVTPEGPLVALILPIEDPGRFSRFRLVVEREGTGETVWATDALVLTGLAETSVALPRDLLPSGDYVLRLSGLEESGPQPLAAYRLRVE